MRRMMSRMSRVTCGATAAFVRNVATSPVVFPGVLLGFIYYQTHLYWLRQVGSGSWAPAWPPARTRLVLSMVAVPLWAAYLSLGMIIMRLLQQLWRHDATERAHPIELGYDSSSDLEQQAMLERTSSAGSSPTISSHGHHRRQSSQAYPGVPKISLEHRWRLKLGAYLSLVVMGLFLLFTYEQPDDVRYGADVRRAVKYPKAQGYSNGGALTDLLPDCIF